MGIAYTQLTWFNSSSAGRGVQYKAVHLALSTLGLQFPQSVPGFMGSFSASMLLSEWLFWKAKVKLKTMTEQMCHYIGGMLMENMLIYFVAES